MYFVAIIMVAILLHRMKIHGFWSMKWEVVTVCLSPLPTAVTKI